jgi:hypothetical protein
MGGKGDDITVKGGRETGEWVDGVVLKPRAVGEPRDGPGICSASWGSPVASGEAPVGAAWRGWVGEVRVGLVGEDRTCARVSTKELRDIICLPNCQTQDACSWC